MNNQTNIYKKLFYIIKPYALAVLLGIIGLICTKAIEAGIYKFLVPKLINEGFITRELYEHPNIYPLVIILVAFLWGGTRFINKYFIGFSTRKVAKDLRCKILVHILLVPISFFNKNAIGNLISKVNYDVEQIARALADSVLELLSSIVSILFFLGVMLSFSWQLTLVALIMAPVISMFLKFINIKIRKYSERVQHSIGNISHLTHELIEASQVIRIFEAIPAETNRINKLLNYNIQQELKFVLVSGLSEATIRIITGWIIAVLVYLVAIKVVNIDPGSFGGLCGAMFALVRPVKQLGEVNSVIAKGLAAAYSVFELLELPIEQFENFKQNNLLKNNLNNNKIYLKLNNLNFSYSNNLDNSNNSEQKILNNINLIFEPGKITAIIGRSGSGKSTLVSLLPRFYDLDSGEITLNNININDLNLYELRKQYAVVNQHIVLLNDTIANNIAYGAMNTCSIDEIITAATAANAMEFIEKLPLGLNTYIGSNGHVLSGGQRQRIAIARALLKHAPILILDEATSALDPYSEQLIQVALNSLKPDLTIIIIAHRMSTIKNADQIAILDHGSLVAVGTHEELATNIYYSNLYNNNLDNNLDNNLINDNI